MAFQLPRVNRFQPQAEPSVGRLQVNTPDPSRGQAAQTAAVGNLVEGLGKMYAAYERDSAETEATNAASEYDSYSHEELLKIKDQDGDPDPVYQKYEEGRLKKKQEIQDKYKDSSELVKSLISEKLETRDSIYADRALTAKYAQKTRYEDSVNKSAVAMLKNDMFEATAIMDPAKPESVSLQTNIEDIEKEVLRYGKSRGLVNEDGTFLPSLQERLAKETSEGISDTIENLLRSKESRQVQLGNMLYEKYKDRIDTVNQKKLNTVKNDSGTEQQAFIELDKVKNLAPDEAMRRLKDIPGEVGEKARAKLNTFRAQMDEARESADKRRAEIVGKIILDRQASGQPFLTVDELRDDKKISRILPSIGSKRTQAILAMVEQPAVSSREAKINMMEFISEQNDKTLLNLPYEDLLKARVGLSKRDGQELEKRWKDANSETGAEKHRNLSMMTSNLQKQLDRFNYIQKNDFGKYEDEDYDKLIEAQNEFIKIVDEMPTNLSYKERQDWIDRFAISKVKEEVFVPPERKAAPRFEGTLKFTNFDVNKKETPPADLTKIPKLLTPEERLERQKMYIRYRKENKASPTPQQLEQYIADKKKGS